MKPAFDKNIPIPPRASPYAYWQHEMEIGDSFWTEDERASYAAYEWGRRHGRVFTRRKVDRGYRIWRVA